MRKRSSTRKKENNNVKPTSAAATRKKSTSKVAKSSETASVSPKPKRAARRRAPLSPVQKSVPTQKKQKTVTIRVIPPAPPPPEDSDGSRWSIPDETELLSFLDGERSRAGDGNLFRDATWNAASLFLKSKRIFKDAAACQRKYKKLRKIHEVIYIIKSRSGWAWTDENGANICSDSPAALQRQWESFVVEYPNAKPFKNAGWSHLQAMDRIVPIVRVRGTHVFNPRLGLQGGAAEETEELDSPSQDESQGSQDLFLNAGGPSYDWPDEDWAYSAEGSQMIESAPVPPPQAQVQQPSPPPALSEPSVSLQSQPQPQPTPIQLQPTPVKSKRVHHTTKVTGPEALLGLQESMESFRQTIRDGLKPQPTATDRQVERQERAIGIVMGDNWLTDEQKSAAGIELENPAAVTGFLMMSTSEPLRRNWYKRKLGLE